MTSRLRRVPDDEVELSRHFTHARLLDRGEVNGDRIAGFRIANAPPDPVLFVPRVPLDIALRGEELLGPLLDLVVNVGRAAGIRHGLDRAEVVFAGRAGQEAAESLKIPVALSAVVAPRVQIGAIVVALPDLDDGVADRFAARIEDLAREMRNRPHGGGEGVVEDDQIVVGVEGKFVGIERTFRLSGGAHQFFGEDAPGS